MTWDGTGYGIDGTIWGGEFLLGDASGFERVAHLRPFRLPGGDAAVKEPRRVALALLWELFGDAALEMDDLAPIRALRPAERKLLAQMLAQGRQRAGHDERGTAVRRHRGADRAAPTGQLRGPGRDGVGVRGGCGRAWARIRLRLTMRINGTRAEVRSVQPSTRQPSILDWRPLLDAVLTDLRRGVATGIMAARFHNALVEAIVAVAQAAGERRVALTGGCFQNRLLTERAAERLERAGFEVLLHRQVPPNDGGISLGQVAIAAAQLSGNS